MVDQHSSVSLNIDHHLGYDFTLQCREFGPVLCRFIAQILQ